MARTRFVTISSAWTVRLKRSISEGRALATLEAQQQAAIMGQRRAHARRSMGIAWFSNLTASMMAHQSQPLTARRTVSRLDSLRRLRAASAHCDLRSLSYGEVWAGVTYTVPRRATINAPPPMGPLGGLTGDPGASFSTYPKGGTIPKGGFLISALSYGGGMGQV